MDITQGEIYEYIYNWLTGLEIGKVFQDRKPFDDTTKQRDLRTYIVFEFPDGLIDMGGFFHGVCNLIIGCRDKNHFVADMPTLNAAAKRFTSEFDYNKNDTSGTNNNHYSFIDVELVDFYSDNIGNHEFSFVFDVFANSNNN